MSKKKKEKVEEPKKGKVVKKKKNIVPASLPVLVPTGSPAAEPVAAPPAPAAAPKPKKNPARKKKADAVEIVITNDDIALRAYFIAEKRRHNGHWGDETGDWVEAERQLREEALQKKK